MPLGINASLTAAGVLFIIRIKTNYMNYCCTGNAMCTLHPSIGTLCLFAQWGDNHNHKKHMEARHHKARAPKDLKRYI